MKKIAFIIFLVPSILLGQGVFTPVTYDQASVGDLDQAYYIGSGKAAVLSNGEAFEINIDSDFNFSMRFIENTGLNQNQLTRYDVNLDGKDDLITLSSSGGSIYNYLSTPDRFDYISPLRSGRAFQAQDFDDDGIDDLIIDGYVYHHNPDGSLERIFRRSPSNDYLFKTQHVMDVDQDGDLDVMVNLVQNIGYLERDSTDRLTLRLISQFNESCTWMQVLKTGNGQEVIYYSASAQKIRRIIFFNGTYSTEDLVVDQPNYGFKTTVGDLDGDGNEELLITNSQIGSLYILSYNPMSGEVIYKKHSPGVNQQFMIVDDMGETKLVGISATTLRVYSVDNDMNLTFEKSSVGNMNLGTFIDINGDGYTDMVNSSYQRRYYGSEDFGNIAPFSVPEPGGSFSDFDDDGDADYILDEFIYENIGDGVFGPAINNPGYMTYPDPDIFFTNVIYEGDMDMDGDIDLLSYNVFGEPLLIHENVNNDYFLDGELLAGNDVISGTLKGIKLLDLDGDSDNDILMVAASGMVWFRNNGNLQFDGGMILYEGDFRPISFAIDEANGDEYPDILLDLGKIDAGTAKGETHLFQGTVDGPQHAKLITTIGGYKKSAFIEFNGIGIKDIIISGADFLSIAKMETFDQDQILFEVLSQDFDLFGNYLVNDVDSDGDDDIIVYGGTALRYYLKDEDGIDGLCPYENVIIYNEDQLEKYRLRFGFCSELPGSLFVGGASGWSDISDLSALSNINKIHGNVTLKHLLSPIGNFVGLSNLDSIGGDLTLYVVRPSGLYGLRNIKTIGGDFRVDNLYGGVKNFDELLALEYLGGGVTAQYSDIQNIDRIFMSNRVGGNVRLFNLDELDNVNFFEQVDTIDGVLEIGESAIYNLSSLKNIEYLEGINLSAPACQQLELNLKRDSLQGDFVIGINGGGDFIQTNNLKHIGGDFFISAGKSGNWDELTVVQGNFTGGIISEDETSFNKLETVGESFGFGFKNAGDYSHFSSLEKVGKSFFISKSAKSLNGLQALDSIGSSLQSALSPNLVDLTDLSEDLYVKNQWVLVLNQNLNVCDIPALCKHIEEGRAVEIRENASQCDDISDIKCIGESITGTAFFDFNQDGIRDEVREAALSNVSLHFDNNNDSLITSTNGFYQRFLQDGQSFDVNASSIESWMFTTAESYSIDSFIPDQSPNVFDFGYYPIEQSLGFSSNLNASLFLCDRPFELSAFLRNTGTNVSNGYLKIVYTPELQLSPDFTEFTSHDIDTRTVTVDFEDWYPYFTMNYKIPFIAPSANELSNEDIAITIQMIDIDGSQVETVVHEDNISLGLLCAYDPNDKLVSSTDKSGNIRINEQDDELIYTIRFQNTGNFYAEDVRVTDIISEDLDLSTFTFLSSSHDVDITMREREVTFMFEDIFLIDSTASYLESQGYVSFSIKPYTVILGEEFDNQANIFFDYNDPIVTNIAESVVYDPYLDIKEHNYQGAIKIFPQPASELIHIDVSELTKGAWNYSLLDISGKTILDNVYATKSRVAIDISTLHNGVYTLTITSNRLVKSVLISIIN
ncbi:MAG: putative repeat protein (TIGR01451 family) [Saprospiraceae bacterium]|jgi:uncharacterized repeat protein (TIGR01451 family)